jgi:hypothetical protein
VANLPDQPALGEHLHPGADGGCARADPHEAEVAVLKCFENALQHGGQAAAALIY